MNNKDIYETKCGLETEKDEIFRKWRCSKNFLKYN